MGSTEQNVSKEPHVDLVCPTCGRRTAVMWTPLNCDACWYVMGGGDQAPDEWFMFEPFARLVEA